MAEEILFRINLTGAESIKDLKTQVNALRKELEESDKSNIKASQEIANKYRAASQELKLVTKQVQDYVKAQNETRDFPNTIQGMRDKLSALNKEWKNTEIGTNAFKDLEASMSATTDKLKKLEAATGDNRRNVGNYASALQGLKGPIGGAASGVMGFNKALNANPILAIITLIIAFIGKLNENAKVADFFSRVLGGLNKAIAFIIDGFIDLVTNVDKLGQALLHPIDSIRKLFVGMATAAEEGYNAAKSLDEFTVESAKMDAAIRKNQSSIDALTKSLKDKTKSEQERIKIANDIANLEEKNSALQEQKAQRTLDIENQKLKGLSLNAEQQAKLIQLQSDLEAAQDSKKEIAAQRQTRINILLEKQATDNLKKSKEEQLSIIELNNRQILELSNQLAEELLKGQKKINEDFENENKRHHAKQYTDIFEEQQKELALITQHNQDLLQISNLTGNIDEQLEAQRAVNDALRAEEVAAAQARGEDVSLIYQKYDAIDLQLKKQNEEAKLQIVSQTFGQLAQIAGQNAAAGKSFAIAQAGINTYLGATKALSADYPPFNFILAAATVAAGVANIQRIAATDIKGFAEGGLSGQLIGANDGLRIKRSNGDNLLATVRTGEVILNERHQALLGGSGTFRAIGVPGFAGSGLTPGLGTTASSADNIFQASFEKASEMIKATNARIDRFKVVNVESEVTDTQNRVTNIEARATA